MKNKLLKKAGVIVSALLLTGGIVLSNGLASKAARLGLRLDSTKTKVIIMNPKYEYTGNQVKPTANVEYNGKKLKEGKDYKTSYKNNIEPGTGTLTVTGIGQYKGSKSAKFIINQKPSKVKFEGEEFFAIAATGKYLVDIMAQDYLTNPDDLTYVDAGIGDAFMLFPKTNDVKFTIQTVILDANLQPKETLAKNVTGGVVIWSNPVEYSPFIQVVATCKGKKVVVPICYNGMDGRLSLPNSKYVKDITP